jgi:multicomponent K+:H+ antiporter subunit D
MNGAPADAIAQLIIAPILLPLLSAALMLLGGARSRPRKAVLNVVSCVVGVGICTTLLIAIDGAGSARAVSVYLPSNWPVPFGIVLVLDRLSALMLVLTAFISLAALLFALSRWQRAGVHFHSLFQLQLMGLNGAFLTGDLFNLFVFFEVMLVASYGLLLHASGERRVQAGLHYIAVNLLASSLFLIGAAMLYGVTGTLNLADMARKLGQIPPADRGLLHAGAAVLGMAFITKAAIWPLNFWLLPAYTAASPPVAALFAVMTKVGFYAVLRIWTLFFPAGSSGTFLFGADALILIGLATLAFGTLGVWGAQRLDRVIAFSLIVSSGTLMAAAGFKVPELTGGALYYLAGSTLAASAFFLLSELLERSRRLGDDPATWTVPREGAPFMESTAAPASPPDANLDDEERALIGRALPAALVFLGLSFTMCALVTAGLPPFSGFLAKVVMLTALLRSRSLESVSEPAQLAAWSLLALLIVSGLATTIALVRIGIRYVWAPQGRPPPVLRMTECLPVALLLTVCVGLVLGGSAVLGFTQAAAETLLRPDRYIDAVLSARPIQAPTAPPKALP